MATDALSDLLRTVRLTGAAYFEIAAQAPWSVRSPAREMMLPRILPGADHLIAYHVVTQGRCFASLSAASRCRSRPAKSCVFTNADPHVMSSSAGMRAEPPSADMIEIASAGRLPFHINLMNDGAPSATLVCGYLACDARPFNPLLEALPPMLKAGDGRRNDSGWVGQFIHFAVAEVADKRAGSESVLTKLSELMFIDVVRRYIETLPPQDTGWLAGLARSLCRQGAGADPCAAVLQLDHGGPWRASAGPRARCWPSGSPSSSECPPMHYLAKWRMQVASETAEPAMRTWRRSPPRSATNSEAAFSRAFKKMIGVAPSVWRQGVRSPPQVLTCRPPRAVGGAKSRHEAASLVEPMHARIGAAALQQDLIAIAFPRLVERGSDHRATVAASLEVGMGRDVFDDAVLTAAAQQIGRGDQHAGRDDPANPHPRRIRQRPRAPASRPRSVRLARRLRAPADVGGGKQRQQRAEIVGIGQSCVRHRAFPLINVDTSGPGRDIARAETFSPPKRTNNGDTYSERHS